jgi:hypothetical protein
MAPLPLIYPSTPTRILRRSWWSIATTITTNCGGSRRATRSINYHDPPSGRYLALSLDHEEPRIVNFDAKRTAADFTPAAIARRGTR